MHHSTRPDLEMTERMKEMLKDPPEPNTIGATGRFPEGKLTEADEGEIKFRIGYLEGKVVLDFGQAVTWMGMSPTQAKDLARLLIKHANPITR